MKMIRDLYKYLRGKRRFKRPPSHLVNPINWKQENATQAQLVLINYCLARDKSEAQRLLNKYGTWNPYEVIDNLPKPKKRTWKHRLMDLIRKIDGHDPSANKHQNADNDTIDVKYTFK